MILKGVMYYQHSTVPCHAMPCHAMPCVAALTLVALLGQNLTQATIGIDQAASGNHAAWLAIVHALDIGHLGAHAEHAKARQQQSGRHVCNNTVSCDALFFWNRKATDSVTFADTRQADGTCCKGC
jgi:hypothetical protein